MNVLIVTLLILMAAFLILLVLVQRGRGGGLAGALGGMGGQSAFGAKAGDTFTKVTMWTAFAWIVFCVVSVKLLSLSAAPPPPPPPAGFNESGGPAAEGTDGDVKGGTEGSIPQSPADPSGGSGNGGGDDAAPTE